MFSRLMAGIAAGTALSLAFLAPVPVFAEDAKTVEVKVLDIKLKVPETWKQKDVSGFRAAQFDLPAADGVSFYVNDFALRDPLPWRLPGRAGSGVPEPAVAPLSAAPREPERPRVLWRAARPNPMDFPH